MLSTTTSSSSSLSAAQKSQQQWEKKKRTLAAASSTSTSRRPSDLAWRSPLRLRLYGGASAVAVSARHLNDNRHGNDDNYDGDAASVAIVTNDEENNHKNGHHNQNHSASRKMYLSPQMIKAIKSETEALPLPASLASVAMTLLNSTLLWDAYDATDGDNYDSSVKHNNTNTNQDGDDEPTCSNNNFTARFQAAMTTSNHHHNNNDNDGDDLSKYFSGITINDEQQQRQATKLQFDNLCKGLITKGNHVMLSSWGEVRERLGEEFLFSTLGDDDVDDDDGVEEEGGVTSDAVGATATNEEAEVAA
eukprot:scaffold2386_cov126-Skeletonema_marinoi.AAC.6